jgi:hypothetical protein
MGHYTKEAIRTELEDIYRQGFDEVVLACQENDFHHFTGKVQWTPAIAHELGIKVLINLWGYASAFGGGRISRVVADFPESMVVDEQGRPRPLNWDGDTIQPGCPNHPKIVERARVHAAAAIAAGADGFFWDEPTKFNCYCGACRALFRAHFRADLVGAPAADVAAFRNHSIALWVEGMSHWVKAKNASLVTSTCVMTTDRDGWPAVASSPSLDSLGTDTYWEFSGEPLAWMEEPCRALLVAARAAGKSPHLWLQCWKLHRGREAEIETAAKMLATYGPDTLYVWAYRGQLGTTETCEEPELAWASALRGLHAAGMKPRP